jgi:hypothetical protein
MLMRYKDALDLLYGKANSRHPALGLPTGDSGIDQNGFVLVTYIIAVTVATGVNRGNK